MANIDRIVNVQVSLNTTGISKEGFSTLLIVGEHNNTLNRVTTYTSPDSMLDDGFKATDELYLAATDAFSQIPRPNKIKIGRRNIDTIIVSVKEVKDNTDYTLTLVTKKGKNEYTFTSAASATANTIVTGLKTQLDKNTDFIATINSDQLQIKCKTSNAFTASSANLTISNVATKESLADTMSAIVASDNDFYGIALTSRKKEDILELAQWTEAHNKLFGCVLNESNVKDSEATNDTGSLLKQNNYYRTFWFYHKQEGDYPECAVFARCFAINPGGETWANKKLAGVMTDDITETEYIAITNKNGNTFENFRNVAITQNGKVAAGEWIDVIRFRDWLEEEIKTNVFSLLINSDKVPYTDAGIATIQAQIVKALGLGQSRGGIAPDEYDSDGNLNKGYVTSVPLASDIPTNTKANRILEDVIFTARLAGAIHVVEIKGSLTYEKLISK